MATPGQEEGSHQHQIALHMPPLLHEDQDQQQHQSKNQGQLSNVARSTGVYSQPQPHQQRQPQQYASSPAAGANPLAPLPLPPPQPLPPPPLLSGGTAPPPVRIPITPANGSGNGESFGGGGDPASTHIVTLSGSASAQTSMFENLSGLVARADDTMDSMASRLNRVMMNAMNPKDNETAFPQNHGNNPIPAWDSNVSTGYHCVDLIVKYKNCQLLLWNPRKFTNLRWADSVKDHMIAGQLFAKDQFYKVYQRVSPKYLYHPLQTWNNLVRRFNATAFLRDSMQVEGTKMFYHLVCGRSIGNEEKGKKEGASMEFISDVDLTTLKQIQTIKSAADFCFEQTLRATGKRECATMARTCFVRGFSRPIDVNDYEDWKRFRTEMRDGCHVAAKIIDNQEHNYASLQSQGQEHREILVAVSYKAKEVKISRRIFDLDEEGNRKDDKGTLQQEEERLTQDFVNDLRWEQMIRICRQIAKDRHIPRVRLWIDRLVMYGLEKEEKKRRYGKAKWWDFGLLAYGMCPVARLYEADEKYFGTDFWRKLEAVMGVAGVGLFMDDYMLRKYDLTIFYGPSIYRRMGNGIGQIGGQGTYVRAVSLAVATAVLTDGLTVRGLNEDKRTKQAIIGWKAWALDTIAEGAYSSSYPALLRERATPLEMTMERFRTIVLWESFVSTSACLEGNSYLDMSFQRSKEWGAGGTWDGVIEWTGMVPNAVSVSPRVRAEIEAYLTDRVRAETWTATSGHSAALLELEDQMDLRAMQLRRQLQPLALPRGKARSQRTPTRVSLKRTLAVGLTRYSSSSHGHVVAVAEATGLWGERILPWWLRHYPLPESDQEPVWDNTNGFEVIYHPMRVVICCSTRNWIFITLLVSLLVLSFMYAGFLFYLFPFLFLYLCCALLWRCLPEWPWGDSSDFGEAVFDNLLMHGLYGAGIKVLHYRRLVPVSYNQIEWN